MSDLRFNEMLGDTLAQVNVVREAFGYGPLYELPDAKRGDTKDCLYYRALKDVGCTGVGGSGMSFASERQARAVAELWGSEANGNSVAHPRNITKVISDFDNGRTPQFDV